MKRSMILFAIVALATLPLVGATKSMSGSVRQVIEKAITNELDAVAKYDACAAKAQEEGYPGAASLFKAAAASERTHGRRFEKLLHDRGVEFTAPVTGNRQVWATIENLRNASNDETAERDGIYKDAISTCKGAGDEEAATLFDNTRDSEVEHANLFAAAARQLDSLKTDKTVYYCDLCGYTTDIRLPMCPVCRAGAGHVHGVD
jgi:rubrerythrin